MKNINHVSLSGNLVADSEFDKVLKFTIANNENRRDGDEWEEYANYFDCVIFGNYGAAMEDILKRGTKVCISGRLSQSRWEDKETGYMKSRIQVVVDNVEAFNAKAKEKDEPKKNYRKR